MAFKDEVSSLDRIATALEELSKAEGAGIPEPKNEDNGKVLGVDEEGKWALVSPLATDGPFLIETSVEGTTYTMGETCADVYAACQSTGAIVIVKNGDDVAEANMIYAAQYDGEYYIFSAGSIKYYGSSADGYASGTLYD